MYAFRVGRSTIGEIIPETEQAIFDHIEAIRSEESGYGTTHL